MQAENPDSKQKQLEQAITAQEGLRGVLDDAIIEATILATRLHLVERNDVEEKMAGFEAIVDKTGGVIEREAMRLVREFILKAGDR